MKNRYVRFVVPVGATMLALAIAACNPVASSAGNVPPPTAAGATAAPAANRPATFKAADPTLTTAAVLTMVADHFDNAHGLAVDLQASGTSSTIIVDAVVNGQAEFGSPGATNALQAIKQGADLKIIAGMVNNLQVTVINNDAMKRAGVSPDAPVADRVHAMKGFTIGTGAVASAHYQILRAWLKQYGLDPDKDVTLVGQADSSALITGLEQGRYDAIVNASGIVEQSVADKAGTIWISGPRGDIPGFQDIKTAVIVARGDTIQNHRDDVEALRAALGDALQAVNNDHAATGRTLKDTFFPKLDPSVWDLAWNAATTSYPSNLAFPQAAYDYWIANHPQGADSFKNINYKQAVYDPAQAS